MKTHTEQPIPTPTEGEIMHDKVIALLQERKAIGIERYNTALQAFNGRCAGRDLIEELADAMVYAMQLFTELAYYRSVHNENPKLLVKFIDFKSALLTRTRKTLNRNNIDSFERLLSVDDPMRWNQFGRGCLKDLIDNLHKVGLSAPQHWMRML